MGGVALRAFPLKVDPRDASGHLVARAQNFWVSFKRALHTTAQRHMTLFIQVIQHSLLGYTCTKTMPRPLQAPPAPQSLRAGPCHWAWWAKHAPLPLPSAHAPPPPCLSHSSARSRSPSRKATSGPHSSQSLHHPRLASRQRRTWRPSRILSRRTTRRATIRARALRAHRRLRRR